MSGKADRKRLLILEGARKVFIDKGFKQVTMKDIVEAAGISRGGLYLYFSSVKEVFLAVLEQESSVDDEAALERVMQGDADEREMLGLYLARLMRRVLDDNRTLGLAEDEFFSLYGSETFSPHPLRKRFNDSVQQIARLITLGVRGGRLVCADPERTARSVLYVLEGLRVQNRIAPVGEEEIESELEFMLDSMTGEVSGRTETQFITARSEIKEDGA